jgi:peptide/nickel transport system substrate-binding protein
MERHFTVKDLVFLSGLLLVLITLVLTMYMIDRQWLKLSELETRMREQASDLRGLRDGVKALGQRLDQGVSLSGQGGSTARATDVPEAFRRAQAATFEPDFGAGDWLVQAFGTGLKTITPLVSTDAYASEVQGYVQESLLTRNPETLDWEGLLAKDWDVSDDGLTYVFHLRPGLTFSDGEPLTAEDVAFTFRYIMDPRIAAPRQRAYYDKMASVHALGPLDVEFRYKEPYFEALALAGGMSVLPEHFYAPYLEHPQDFNQSKGLLLGSGPYRLKDPKGWTPDLGLVELVRNPRYWGPVQPPFDRLLWKNIANDTARLTTFRNGDIDVYGARPIEYQDLLKDQALLGRTQHFEYMSPTAGYSYIGWNESRNGKSTRFADPRVRQAMTYLTDRPRVVKEIMLGYAEPAVSPFSPRSPQHDPKLEPRAPDPGKARALLAEAGYADRDGDGVLEGPGGEPFRFELVYFQDNDDTRRIVLFLKDLYAAAGILLEPKPTEWSVMLDLITRKDFEAITLGWTSGVEIDIYQMFHSSQTTGGGDNFVNHKSPELDRLIEEARRTVDEAKRMPLWQACERILYQDQPYTFLMRRKSMVFVDDRVHNLETTRLGLNLGSVPVEIYVPPTLQKYHD